jgi:hypothetical protein
LSGPDAQTQPTNTHGPNTSALGLYRPNCRPWPWPFQPTKSRRRSRAAAGRGCEQHVGIAAQRRGAGTGREPPDLIHRRSVAEKSTGCVALPPPLDFLVPTAAPPLLVDDNASRATSPPLTPHTLKPSLLPLPDLRNSTHTNRLRQTMPPSAACPPHSMASVSRALRPRPCLAAPRLGTRPFDSASPSAFVSPDLVSLVWMQGAV